MKPTFPKRAVYLLALLLGVATVSCHDDDSDDPEPGPGTAQLTLTVAGGQILLSGPCTWGVSPNPGGASTGLVAAYHEADEARQSRIYLHSAVFPTATATYGLVERNNEDATHAAISFADLNTAGPCVWNSYAGSGNVTLTVTGTKVTATLGGIPLNPAADNPAPYNVQGSLSGSMEFYKPN